MPSDFTVSRASAGHVARKFSSDPAIVFSLSRTIDRKKIDPYGNAIKRLARPSHRRQHCGKVDASESTCTASGPGGTLHNDLQERNVTKSTAALALLLLAADARAQFIYGIQDDGQVLWYQHLGFSDGSPAWRGGRLVNYVWDDFLHVFSGGDGIIYAVTQDGQLLWYRHDGYRDGVISWTGPRVVGGGWNGFTTIFSPGGGVVYGITPGGNLYWYKHIGRMDGTFAWQGPYLVDSGWNTFSKVFAGSKGAIYGITPGGTLKWYKHLGQADGTPLWNGPTEVGTGWHAFTTVFAALGGVIYGRTPDGRLLWYRHLGYADGTSRWFDYHGRPIGQGWAFPKIFDLVTDGFCANPQCSTGDACTTVRCDPVEECVSESNWPTNACQTAADCNPNGFPSCTCYEGYCGTFCDTSEQCLMPFQCFGGDCVLY